LEITDLGVLRALAHPRRQRMLQYLGLHGPATSAMVARALDLNTGATSYHLRELARHGFVEEMPERAHGRERWWHAPGRDLRIPPRSRQDEAMRAVVDEMARLELADDIAELTRAQAQRDEMGPWGDGFQFSRGTVRLTLDELRELFEDYIRLLNRYRRPDEATPPGTRTVLTRFFAFPAPAPEPEPVPTDGSAQDDDDAPPT
jgi:DNA-binding transcriptional ArsR family regulator